MQTGQKNVGFVTPSRLQADCKYLNTNGLQHGANARGDITPRACCRGLIPLIERCGRPDSQRSAGAASTLASTAGIPHRTLRIVTDRPDGARSESAMPGSNRSAAQSRVLRRRAPPRAGPATRGGRGREAPAQQGLAPQTHSSECAAVSVSVRNEIQARPEHGAEICDSTRGFLQIFFLSTVSRT